MLTGVAPLAPGQRQPVRLLVDHEHLGRAAQHPALCAAISPTGPAPNIASVFSPAHPGQLGAAVACLDYVSTAW